jgi:hypothetical protein
MFFCKRVRPRAGETLRSPSDATERVGFLSCCLLLMLRGRLRTEALSAP